MGIILTWLLLSLERVFHQSFEMANILSSLKVNNTTLIAAMLYPFVDSKFLKLNQVSESCSKRIATQLKGVVAMDAIRSLQSDQGDSDDVGHIDNLRKMLLVMVDDVRVDMEWVRRLHELMALGQRIVMALGCLLALGVLLVIGNTVRLEIENRRDEIVIVKLVGEFWEF